MLHHFHLFNIFEYTQYKNENPTSPMSEISGNKDIRENVVFYHGFIIAIPSSASFTTLACYFKFCVK